MRKNFEKDLISWLENPRDFKNSPPEILAAVYGMHQNLYGKKPKKKAGVPLKENTRQKQGRNDITDLGSRGREASNPLD